jgi:hypothetical protein
METLQVVVVNIALADGQMGQKEPEKAVKYAGRAIKATVPLPDGVSRFGIVVYDTRLYSLLFERMERSRKRFCRSGFHLTVV